MAGDEAWTVTPSDAEGGAGKLAIACSGATCTVTWNDTDIRDLCGFTGNLSGSTSYTSASHVKGLWLPDGPPRSLYGLEDDGVDESDHTSTESSAGHVVTLGYQRKTVQPNIVWQGISRARTRVSGESVTGESWQQFVRDVLYAEATYISARKIRVAPNADNDTTHTDYRHSGPVPEPEPMIDGWIEQWAVSTGRLVKVP